MGGLSMDGYQIFLKYKNFSSDSEGDEDYKSESLFVNKEGLNLLKGIFWIVKNEMEEFTSSVFMGNQNRADEFKKISILLLNNFGTQMEMKNGDIEEILIRHLKKLKKFKFHSSILISSLEDIVDKLKGLRQKRIDLWTSILKEVVNKKALYTKEIKRLKKKSQGLF